MIKGHGCCVCVCVLGGGGLVRDIIYTTGIYMYMIEKSHLLTNMYRVQCIFNHAHYTFFCSFFLANLSFSLRKYSPDASSLSTCTEQPHAPTNINRPHPLNAKPHPYLALGLWRWEWSVVFLFFDLYLPSWDSGLVEFR